MILNIYGILGAIKGSPPPNNQVYSFRSSATIVLAIPEIIETIATFLPRQDLVRCLRISTTFHDVIIPTIWRKITLTMPGGSKSRIPSGPGLHRYKHHIQEIHFGGAYVREILQLKKCSNLQTIRISTINSSNQVKILRCLAPFIRAHSSTLQKILVTPLFHELSVPPDEFIDAIIQCSNLKVLLLKSFHVKRELLPKVLKACSIPHTLGLHLIHFDYKSEESFGYNFPSIQDISSLYSGHSSSVSGQRGAAELTRHCPNLRSLTLGISRCIGPMPEYYRYFDFKWNCDDFLNTLLQDTLMLPLLESLDISCTTTVDEKLYGDLLKQLDQIKSINAKNSDIGQKWLEALITVQRNPWTGIGRRLSDSISILDIEDCRFINGQMTQAILETCPVLESFRASIIRTSDIMQGGEWVCRNLKKISVAIMLDEEQEHELSTIHFNIYSRLLSLSKLQELFLKRTTNGCRTFRLESQFQSSLKDSLKELKVVSFPV